MAGFHSVRRGFRCRPDADIAVGAYRARNEWKHHSAFRTLAEYLCQNFREIVQISSKVGWITRHSISPQQRRREPSQAGKEGRWKTLSANPAAHPPCDRTFVVAMANGIGAILTNEEKERI